MPNVHPGDLAEFICGPNRGRRCIALERCAGDIQMPFAVWHVTPLQCLEGVSDLSIIQEWPPGYVLTNPGGDFPHARDPDLRPIRPDELDKADLRDASINNPNLIEV